MCYADLNPIYGGKTMNATNFAATPAYAPQANVAGLSACRIIILFAVAVAVLSGCANRPEIAYTWLADNNIDVPLRCSYVYGCAIENASFHDPGTRSARSQQSVRVLFVTDRRIVDLWPPRFGSRRSSEFSLGVCDVRLIESTGWCASLDHRGRGNGNVPDFDQSWFDCLMQSDANDDKCGSADPKWLAELRDTVWHMHHRRVPPAMENDCQNGECSEKQEHASACEHIEGKPRFFVYIHGYNRSFDDAVKDCAALIAELQHPAIPVVFSWSSAGRVTRYLGDLDNASLAAPALVKLLRVLNEQSNGHVDVFAHSMGAQVLMEALRFTPNDGSAMENGDDVGTLLREVILAAPDVDREHFLTHYTDQLANAARRVTIYIDNRDTTLWISSILRTFALTPTRRVGGSFFFRDPLVIKRGSNEAQFDSVVVSALRGGTKNRHGYAHTHPDYLHDIREVLAGTEAGNSKRSLAHREILPHRWFHYWEIRPVPPVRRQQAQANGPFNNRNHSGDGAH